MSLAQVRDLVLAHAWNPGAAQEGVEGLSGGGLLPTGSDAVQFVVRLEQLSEPLLFTTKYALDKSRCPM